MIKKNSDTYIEKNGPFDHLLKFKLNIEMRKKIDLWLWKCMIVGSHTTISLQRIVWKRQNIQGAAGESRQRRRRMTSVLWAYGKEKLLK